MGSPEGKGPLLKSTLGLQDNIKMYLIYNQMRSEDIDLFHFVQRARESVCVCVCVCACVRVFGGGEVETC
jgi:hypothetical protein